MKSFLGIFPILFFAGASLSFVQLESSSNSVGFKEGFAVLRFRESEDNNFHKYYVSVSNATYNQRTKSVQMVTRFFIDDLEDVLNARLSNPVVLGDKAKIEEFYPELRNYLAAKLTVQINGEQSIPNFLGAEYESDQTVCYIEIPCDRSPEMLTMKFIAFIELFEEQKNLVHLKINGERRTLLMDQNKPTDSVKF